MAVVGLARVGELACQRDSYLKELTVEVAKCTERGGVFDVVFQDTILFPAGGGQPSDFGWVNYKDRKIPLLSVARNALECVHTISEFIAPGEKVRLELDWSMRFDHMQQHTGQHLISGLCDRGKLPTLSWNLNKRVDNQPCFVEIPRVLTETEFATLSANINKAIVDQLPISVEWVDAASANCSYIPDAYEIGTLGKLRKIHIGELDSNFCCGTHLKNTNELRAVCLVCQKPGKTKGTNRIYYFIGDRAIDYMQQSARVVQDIKNTLTCDANSAVSNVNKILLEKSALTQSLKEAYKALAEINAAELEPEFVKDGYYVFTHNKTLVPDYSEGIQARLRTVCDQHPSHTFCMVAKPRPSKLSEPECSSIVLLGAHAVNIGRAIFEEFKSKSQLKGGGGGTRWQGKLVYSSEAEFNSVVHFIRDILRKSILNGAESNVETSPES